MNTFKNALNIIKEIEQKLSNIKTIYRIKAIYLSKNNYNNVLEHKKLLKQIKFENENLLLETYRFRIPIYLVDTNENIIDIHIKI